MANEVLKGLTGIPAGEILPSCYIQGAKDALERLLDPLESKAETSLPPRVVPAVKEALDVVREPAERVKGMVEKGERGILAKKHQGVLASFRVNQ